MASMSCTFDAIPRSITSAGSVRFFPFVTLVTSPVVPIVVYHWSFGTNHDFTIDASTTDLLFTDADDYFSVDDRVVLSTTGTLPTGLSSTVCYFVKTASSTAITLSLSSGGATVTYTPATGSGTHTVSHGSHDSTPIFTYPVVAAYTTYDVTLTVTDAAGTSANLTISDFIASDAAANVPAFPTDGTYFPISILFNDGTNQMLVNRVAWTGSSYYLLTPTITDSMDKIGTMKFSLLDVGNSTASEQALVAEGVSLVAIMGKSVVFSGLIRRVTQNTQDGFSSTSKVRKWDIECDSDLARLKKIKVATAANTTYGETIIDSPGNIFRRILT